MKNFEKLVDQSFEIMHIEISDKEKINLKDLLQYNEQCFPPCMRNMFDELIKNNHLKHFARLSLGLFLKGAGLSLED